MGLENDTDFEEMAEAPVYQTEKKKYMVKNLHTYTAHQTMVPVKVETADRGLIEAKPGDWLVEDDDDPDQTIVMEDAALKATFAEATEF